MSTYSHYLKLAAVGKLDTEVVYNSSVVRFNTKTFGYNYGTPIIFMETNSDLSISNSYVMDGLIESKYITRGNYKGVFSLRFSDHTLREFDNYEYNITPKGLEVFNMMKQGVNFEEAAAKIFEKYKKEEEEANKKLLIEKYSKIKNVWLKEHLTKSLLEDKMNVFDLLQLILAAGIILGIIIAGVYSYL